MTIKQLIVGTLVGVVAAGVMLHRLPKATTLAAKPQEKSAVKSSTRANRNSPHKHVSDDRLSSRKLYG